MRDGKLSEALSLLEQTRLQPPWEKLVMQSPFFSQNLERFTRASLLESVGRFDEALSWFDTLCENGPYEFAYLAPAHFRRGIIYERLGRVDMAVDHLNRALELWRDCDPELHPFIDTALSAMPEARKVRP
jgi:tetratricopeptide (TPR) repeat protein